MTITFTRDTLRAAYNYLNETPPFNRWNLPDGDDVVFRVVRDRTVYGWHDLHRGKHVVAVSSATVGQTITLLKTVAHEMVHMHERGSSAACRTGHSAAFHRWAEQVCKYHGFDPKAF